MPTVLGKAPEGKPRGRPPKASNAVPGMINENPEHAPKQQAVPSAWPFPESSDPLDALVTAGPARGLQMALWMIRHEFPEGLKVTPQDIAKMAACTEHLGVQPLARVWRRPAVPPHDGVPAVGNRRAIPPFAGMPAAPFVTIQLVDAKTNDAFRLMENNEEDNAQRIAVEKRNQAKASMPGLISAVRSALARGETSDSLINELCEAAAALARLS